jgi:trimeric autotransporter adhesin
VIGGLGDNKTDGKNFDKATSADKATQAIVIGNGAQATDNATYSVTLGNNAKTAGATGISIGDRAQVVASAANGIALGQSAVANNSGDIAIGQSSSTSTKHTVSGLTIGNATLSTGIAATDNGTVSFGNNTIKRQIQNVGSGEISDTSSDVVTGSQLYHVIKAADEIAKTEYKFQVNGSDIKTMSNKGTSAANNANNVLNFKAGDGLDVTHEGNAVIYKLNADSKQAIADAKTAATTVTNKLQEINQSVTRAETAAGKAEKAKEGAEAAQGKAEKAKEAAETARDEANTAKNDAVTAKNDAVTAKEGAEAAKNDAVTAKTAAETAADKAKDSENTVKMIKDRIEGSGLISKDGKTAFAADNSSGRNSAKASGKDSTAMGYGSEAKGDHSTALGNNAKAHAERSTAIGHNAEAKAAGSVALGEGSVAKEENTVSVGDIGHERRITNVQDPKNLTDAANKRYVDNSISSVRSELKQTDRKLRGGIAGAVAMANIPTVNRAGGTMVGIGVGSFKGQSAVAVGINRASDSNRVHFKMSSSATTSGDYAVGAGMGYQW